MHAERLVAPAAGNTGLVTPEGPTVEDGMDRMDRSLRRHGLAMVLIAALSGGVAGSALGVLASARPTTVVATPAAAAGESSKAATSTTARRSVTSATHRSKTSGHGQPLRRPNRGGRAEQGKPSKGKGGKKGDEGGHAGGQGGDGNGGANQ